MKVASQSPQNIEIKKSDFRKYYNLQRPAKNNNLLTVKISDGSTIFFRHQNGY
jgi:ribosomal protein L25 (general stress protein Ctc)